MFYSTEPRSLRLTGGVGAPRLARDFLAATCSEWRAEQFVETGSLVVSELVSNAVLHAGTDLAVDLEFTGARLTMRVHDRSPALPEPAVARPSGAGGHGLEIVAQIAESWGVDPDPGGGKNVWCVLRAEHG